MHLFFEPVNFIDDLFVLIVYCRAD
jgi:hypothetical protein